MTDHLANQGGVLRAFKMAGIPYVDPSVERAGVSKLRSLNATSLSRLDKTLVIQDNDTPIAVLLNYEQYLIIQNQLHQALDTLETLTDARRVASLKEGLNDMAGGNATRLEDIDPEASRK